MNKYTIDKWPKKKPEENKWTECEICFCEYGRETQIYNRQTIKGEETIVFNNVCYKCASDKVQEMFNDKKSKK